MSQLLSAYHDGELDSAERAQVERHAAACPACAAELAELASLSRLVGEYPPPRLSQIALHRLHDRTDMVMRAGVLRVARVLQAAAACVVVASTLMLMRTSSANSSNSGQEATAQETAVEAAPPWLDVAVTASAETQSLDATTPAAAWYLADVSSRSEDVP
jgi:anti-sigma factor RsiW